MARRHRRHFERDGQLGGGGGRLLQRGQRPAVSHEGRAAEAAARGHGGRGPLLQTGQSPHPSLFRSREL